MNTLKKKNWVASFAQLFLLLTLLTHSAAAQDDPVKRAQEKIEAAIEGRAAAAARVLDVAPLVNAGAAARQQGKTEQARLAFQQAETMMVATAFTERSALTEAVLQHIATELRALNPAPPAIINQPGWSGLLTGKRVTRLVLARYSTYRESLTRILAEEQLPPEAVALIESGFNPHALSPKGALGLWQLMPATARRYSLTVEPGNDHRTHPEHATRAAARYLRDLYQLFGDWKLALAAYNWGEGNLQRAMNKAGLRDFDGLAARGWLPLETRNYVPAVLAAWLQLSVAHKD
jgi:soluble lytic murein transglycosylase-like protein